MPCRGIPNWPCMVLATCAMNGLAACSRPLAALNGAGSESIHFQVFQRMIGRLYVVASLHAPPASITPLPLTHARTHVQATSTSPLQPFCKLKGTFNGPCAMLSSWDRLGSISLSISGLLWSSAVITMSLGAFQQSDSHLHCLTGQSMIAFGEEQLEGTDLALQTGWLSP